MNDREQHLQRLRQEVENDKCPIVPAHVDESHPVWFLAVETMSKRAAGYWRMIRDSQRQRAYADFLAANAEGKVVCDLGCGPGALLFLADFFGAKKCIGVDSQFHPIVYLKGRLPQWEVIQGDFLDIEWPEADIYIHEMIGNNVYQEGLIDLCDAAKERGVYDKLYPNTVKLYDIKLKENKHKMTEDGGVIEPYTEEFLKLMEPITEGMGAKFAQQRWFDPRDNIKDMELIYNGDFYGGLKYEFYSENCCGWEVGFDDKYLFSNFREPTHWCLGNYWDFHNEFNDSPNPYSYGNLY